MLTTPLETFYSRNKQAFDTTINMDDSDSLEVTINVKVEAPKGEYILQVPCGVYYHKGSHMSVSNATYIYKVTIEPVSCYLGDDNDPEKVLMDTPEVPPKKILVKHIEELGETLKIEH